MAPGAAAALTSRWRHTAGSWHLRNARGGGWGVDGDTRQVLGCCSSRCSILCCSMLSRAVLSSTLPATSRQVPHFFVFGFFTGLDAGHVAQPSAKVSTGHTAAPHTTHQAAAVSVQPSASAVGVSCQAVVSLPTTLKLSPRLPLTGVAGLAGLAPKRGHTRPAALVVLGCWSGFPVGRVDVLNRHWR